ncbi:MAG: parallel beta-helix domain-containing protein [Parvularculaceae bacterium]
MNKIACAALIGALALAACGKKDGGSAPSAPHKGGEEEKLLAALIDAQPGDIIELPAGTLNFDRSLSLTVDGVTIRGKGLGETILSFKGQVAGAEGLLVNANDFTIEDLAIEDTKGDALKVNGGKNIVIRRVRTEWTGAPKTSNGAYGLYPVQCDNVLLESNVVIGASDAGLYVGQSNNVIVRNNRAEKNVAGIEIENTTNADVYGNVATDNTGGILVFNMPNLKHPGRGARVYQNEVTANNRKNFGHKGTPVASIPAGSGVVVNSNDDVEIFDNNIKDNKTANVIIASVYSTDISKDGMTEDFDAYPEGIYVHDNRMSGGGKNPDGLDLTALKVAMFGPTGALPDVLWDGYVDAAKEVDGKIPDDKRICVDNGDAATLNADGPNKFKSPKIVTDAVKCALAPLPAVTLKNGLGE